MKINRHNYEAFFLLYVDNELSATDRKAVDIFVQENPDLKMELDLLRQTILKADDIVLDKKDWLYMEEELTALQENLLLYADDELSLADKKTIEGLLLTDLAAQAEWNILQHTKLQPDTTDVFEDKTSLYRREAGRVIAIKWWRVAAAAVLLGFGLWSGISVYTNSSKTAAGSAEIANQDNTNSTQTTTDVPANNTRTIADAPGISTAENVIAKTPAENTAVQNRDKINTVEQNINSTNNPTLQNNVTVQNAKKQDNNLPQSERNRAGKSALQNINITSSNENIVADVQPSNGNSSRVSGTSDEVVRTNTINTNTINNKVDQPVAIVQVSNSNIETENNSRYLNIDDKEKRTTLGGLIRKAKRVVERTTNINTGEGVKIAGFEIALK